MKKSIYEMDFYEFKEFIESCGYEEEEKKALLDAFLRDAKTKI